VHRGRYPEDIPIRARSTPTRAAGQSLSTGKFMEPDTPGRAAAPLVLYRSTGGGRRKGDALTLLPRTPLHTVAL